MGGFLNDLLSRLISPAGSLLQRVPYTPPSDPNRLQEFGGQAADLWNTGVDVGEFVRNAPGQVLGGLAGLPGQAADYLTTPRSQRQAAAPSFADVESGASTNFAGQGVLSGASTTAGRPAASTSAPMRAIRMPDGKMLFTNRPEYGGEEFSTAQAGAMVRAADQNPAARAAAAGPINDIRPPSEFAGKSYAWPSPTEATMRGLVAASARAQAGQPPPSQTLAARGKMTDGFMMQPGPGGFAPSADNPTGAAFSQIEGTPQQQLALQLEQAMGVKALAELAQETAVAKLNPMERATLGSPQAVAMLVATEMLRPKLQQKQAVTEARIKALGTPGTPDFIADEKQRMIAADEIQRAAQTEIANEFAMLGLRPPSGI